MSSDATAALPDTSITAWIQRNPVPALLAGAIVAILVYFFGFVPLFSNGRLSTWVWGWQAWNPETNYEHAKLIPLIVGFLVWNSRDKLKAAKVGSSSLGWVFVAF